MSLILLVEFLIHRVVLQSREVPADRPERADAESCPWPMIADRAGHGEAAIGRPAANARKRRKRLTCSMKVRIMQFARVSGGDF
jgi:hypothetical protein